MKRIIVTGLACLGLGLMLGYGIDPFSSILLLGLSIGILLICLPLLVVFLVPFILLLMYCGFMFSLYIFPYVWLPISCGLALFALLAQQASQEWRIGAGIMSVALLVGLGFIQNRATMLYTKTQSYTDANGTKHIHVSRYS